MKMKVENVGIVVTLCMRIVPHILFGIACHEK